MSARILQCSIITMTCRPCVKEVENLARGGIENLGPSSNVIRVVEDLQFLKCCAGRATRMYWNLDSISQSRER